MSFVTRIYRCKECRAEVERLDRRNEENAPPTCEACGTEMFMAPSAPMVLRESQPDGYKRADAWYIAREAQRLKAQAVNLPPEKRGDLLKEAKSLDREASTRRTSKTTDHKDP